MVDQHLDKLKLKKSHYPCVESIEWDDVMEKASNEFSADPFTGLMIWNDLEIHSRTDSIEQRHSRKTIYGNFTNPPTFLLHNDYYPGSLGEVFEVVSKDQKIKVMHVYFSFGRDNITFGDHYDDLDVLIVQAKGKMKYSCSGIVYTLNPSDSLYIPKGTYHEPIVTEPRLTLSFSWE